MLKKYFSVVFAFLILMIYLTTAVKAEIIHEGDSGSHVRELQQILIAKGLLYGEADGIYGQATVNAIKRFQQSQGIEVDGICGDATFNLLLDTIDTTINIDDTSYDDSNYAIKYGMQGPDVEELQNILIALGYMGGTADGVCGNATVNAIKRFQSTHGLVADGVCGTATFDSINVDAEAYMAGDTSVAYKNNQSSTSNTKTSAKTDTNKNDSDTIEKSYSTVSSGDVISSGMKGDNVKNLQRKLISLGFLSGTPDGICGDWTVAAIKKFQESQGLEADGVAGVMTLSKLNVSYSEESSTTVTKNSQEEEESSVAIAQNSNEEEEESSDTYAGIGSIIRAGMHGDGVTDIQQKLIEHGYLAGEADGFCGARTVAAIKRFQKSVGLTADGVCDLMTYAALENADYNTQDKSWDNSLKETPKGRKMYVEATAYYPAAVSGGSYTARGNRVRRGIIAVDPRVIPLGTRVYIPGYGEAVADDTGGAIKGHIIDIAFDTYSEAINFGRQHIEIYILDD